MLVILIRKTVETIQPLHRQLLIASSRCRGRIEGQKRLRGEAERVTMVGAGYRRQLSRSWPVKRTFPLFFGISAVVERVCYVCVFFSSSVRVESSRCVARRRVKMACEEKEDVWMVGLGVVLLWARRETEWEEVQVSDKCQANRDCRVKGGRGAVAVAVAQGRPFSGCSWVAVERQGASAFESVRHWVRSSLRDEALKADIPCSLNKVFTIIAIPTQSPRHEESPQPSVYLCLSRAVGHPSQHQ